MLGLQPLSAPLGGARTLTRTADRADTRRMQLPSSRKKYSATLKAKVAIEALKGHKTTAQIGTEFSVHPSQVTKWKKAAVAGLPSVFDGPGMAQRDAAIEKELSRAYEEVGRLKVERDWIKKKSGHTA